jgi:hypothetical protein
MGGVGGHPEAIQRLVAALNDQSRYVRAAVAEALGNIGYEKPGVLEGLLAHALEDEEDYVQRTAVRSISKVTGRDFDEGEKKSLLKWYGSQVKYPKKWYGSQVKHPKKKK